MKLFLRQPGDRRILSFLAAEGGRPSSYQPAGMTRKPPPLGWTVDHNRRRIGRGEADFAAACRALQSWAMFPAGWSRVIGPAVPPAAGLAVAVLIRGYGLYFLNATRIVYAIDDREPPIRRFGFAYGTLPAHGERGEERFLVEHDAEGAVWYDLLAYSRPAHWLARLGYPLVRRLQRQFARHSLRAMAEAVQRERPARPPNLINNEKEMP